MPLRDDLVEQRDRWITEICAGLVGSLAGHAVLEPAGIASELGEPGLVRALLAARIAALAAEGRSTGDIAGMMAASPAFITPPELGQLADLAEKVYRKVQCGWITGLACPLGYGLRAWSPESTYLLLLEVWSARRAGSASGTKAKVRRELTRCWGVQDRDWMEGCLSRPADPLRHYPDLWNRLKAEPDVRVANLAAHGWSGNSSSEKAWQRWADRLPFNPLHAEHLLMVGGDLVCGTEARSYLRGLHDQSEGGLRHNVARALEIIEDQLAQVETIVHGLSGFERELLREQTDEEHLQDTFLSALLDWACAPEARSWLDGSAVSHGMWGPLPWWSVTVQDDDQQLAAAAALAEGTLPLGVDHDPAQPDRLELVCRKPQTTSPGLRVRCTFDLTNPAQVGELLLIGRRGNLCIDLLRAADDEPNDPKPVQLGTLRVAAGREVAHLIVELASTAVRDLLPAAEEPDDDGSRNPALGAALRRIDGHHLGPWSCSRQLLVAEPGGTAGGITLETTDPPTTMSRLAEAARSATRTAARPVRERHENGFVYVQCNPGIAGMVKIGYSQRLPEDRASELSCTPVPFPFEVLYRAITSRARDVEQAVHRLLAAHRVASNREWFRVEQHAAERAIRYCRELVTGIGSWQPFPVLHPLRAGDRVTLPLKANQVFVTTAYAHFLAPSAGIVDVWQVHRDGDLLELHVTGDPGRVRGFSDGDPGAEEDPVPFLNRDNTAPNGLLIGRERLMAGDRLSWLSDLDGTSRCAQVVFEIRDFCQVTCRTRNPRLDSDGMPLLLNHVTRSASASIVAAVHEVLALGPPRCWAPRNPDPTEWTPPATHETQPEHWLTQLRPKRKHR